MTGPPVFRVALDVPLRRAFDYLPARTEGAGAAGPPPLLLPGMRVRVPFGRQRMVGVILESAPTSDVAPEKLKPILEVLDRTPVLDAPALNLLRWAAEYYHHPIGEVVASALPKALREGAGAAAVEEWWSLTAQGHAARGAGEPRRAPKQRRLFELLSRHDGIRTETIAEQIPDWREAARALLARGWIGSMEVSVTAPLAEPGPEDAQPDRLEPGAEVQLSEAQHEGVEVITNALGSFAAFVLHGVTGSGKTEVYMRIVERVLAAGRGALILLPEIGLTPQFVGRFRKRFNVPTAVLHSGLSDHERLLAWRAAFSGVARIVIGTRSAVFAPLPDPGILIVDEEHDSSYKQHEGGFRYSARDLAIVRARGSGCPIVLGSATPSLETLQNVATGRYTRLTLPRRADQAAAPRVALVDLRAAAVQSGISTPAVVAIERHLREDGQILVFLNRRGYAPTLLCTACGWIAPCRECDARMTVHLSAGRLKCHHCGADNPLPARCPQCGFAVKPVGQGTERIAETLATLFPAAPLVRLDRDVVRRRGDMEDAMRRMAAGEARILVGTQMVTKGHDFPNVTLVVVLNADQGLFSTDFRGPERLAQTLVQVSGRAGRGNRPGEVLVQTEFPDHPLLLSLLNEGYDGFARAALEERAQASWPPFSRLAALRDSARTAEAALGFLTDARKLARATNVKLLGPVPAAMARRAGRYHAQLLLESADRGALHRFLDHWLPQVESLDSARRVRWALDVDPMELF